MTGSIKAQRSSDKSLGYGLRSLTPLSQHMQVHQPGITLQIHPITLRHGGHQLANRPLRAAYAEIVNQRDQISRLLGQIRDLEIDLPADAIERITTENRTLRQDNRKLTTDNQRLTDRLKAARENNRFLDTRIARLEAELAEHLNLGQNRSKIMPPTSAPDQENHEGPHDHRRRSLR
ncbi:hypothetical protein ACFLIM_39505 [Nonomuraea sp. M3C6]|uniref:Uncharacterized protein n=1 Tax=Nonomuraea marmarensis TaxID=3351344 RepID=A0ABW7AST4_9ACTN